MYIAENIAKLRRERSMIQEALVEEVGVTIDALYGREEARRAIPADKAFERVIDCVRETIVGSIYDPERNEKCETELEKYNM